MTNTWCELYCTVNYAAEPSIGNSGALHIMRKVFKFIYCIFTLTLIKITEKLASGK